MRSQDMNIYTFWIDLDVYLPILKKSGLVSGAGGQKRPKYSPRPKGHRVCLVCAGGGLWTAVAEQKPKVCAKARADASQYAMYSLFSGNFNWPRNHDETEVKISMKSRI